MITDAAPNTLRYSGHESFPLRAGWLRKYYDAVTQAPAALDSDDDAIAHLGIGRNMVRSLEFWADATDVAHRGEDGRVVGVLGRQFFDFERGQDPYMELLDSVALIHWALCTKAGLACWELIFGSKAMNRFSRKQIVEKLKVISQNNKRPVGTNTLDQHAAIFLASYAAVSAGDEASGEVVPCPLQELELIRRIPSNGLEELFELRTLDRLAVLPETFGQILAQYWLRIAPDSKTIPLNSIVAGLRSPGTVFRLSTYGVERALGSLQAHTQDKVRIVDTADSQRVAVNAINDLKEWAGQ